MSISNLKILSIVSVFFTLNVAFSDDLQVKEAGYRIWLYCEQQDDADQWIEANLAMNDKRDKFLLQVIQHDYDRPGEKRIIAQERVAARYGRKSVMWANRLDTISLKVSKKRKSGGYVGVLSLLVDGPGSQRITLDCIPK